MLVATVAANPASVADVAHGAKDGRGVFLGLEAGVGAKLVRGIPEAFLERGVVSIFFRRGDPKHSEATNCRQALKMPSGLAEVFCSPRLQPAIEIWPGKGLRDEN